MRRFVERALQISGSATRQVAAIGAVFLAVRLCWLAGADVLEDAARGLTESPDDPRDPSEQGQSASGDARERRVEDLKEKYDSPKLVQADPSPTPSVSTKARLRRVLVDIGPERSEVFLNGRAVGRVPFAGQIACEEGAPLKIQVLPPNGAPLERTARCAGTLITARN